MLLFALPFLGLVLAPQQAGKSQESADTCVVGAQRSFQEQRYTESLSALHRCLALDPRNAEAYKLVALNAIRIDRLDIAEPALRSAKELTPDDYLVRFHLGALLYTRSLFLQAKPELEKAVLLNSRYIPARLFLGLTLEDVGDEQAAIDTYQGAIAAAREQNSESEIPYLYLGRLLYRLDQIEESLTHLQKADKLKPASAEVLLALAKTLHALKREAESESVLRRALAVTANDPDTHYLLFRVLTSEGKAQEAGAELLRFQELARKPGNDPRRRSTQTGLDKESQ